MNERELSLLQAIGETVKEALVKQETDFTGKINEIKAHVDSQILNLKQEIKNKEVVINDQILEEKTKKIIEEQIKPISNSELLNFEPLINEKIANLAQSLSVPEIPDIETLLSNAIDKLPKPKDGKSVTLDDVKPVIKQGINEIVNNFPKPKDGKDADVKEVAEKLLELMPSPKDGKDGKDALHIELLPVIDESKSYPRGTFATHRGGIWRSFQQTTGMHGWECIINGLYAEKKEMKDARTLVIRSEMADGHVNTSEHTIPTMIYCGVYSIEKEYQTGDVVTWGGSLWHCDEQTKDKPGEHNSKGWTLIVKRGRDGKDRAC